MSATDKGNILILAVSIDVAFGLATYLQPNGLLVFSIIMGFFFFQKRFRTIQEFLGSL